MFLLFGRDVDVGCQDSYSCFYCCCCCYCAALLSMSTFWCSYKQLFLEVSHTQLHSLCTLSFCLAKCVCVCVCYVLAYYTLQANPPRAAPSSTHCAQTIHIHRNIRQYQQLTMYRYSIVWTRHFAWICKKDIEIMLFINYSFIIIFIFRICFKIKVKVFIIF